MRNFIETMNNCRDFIRNNPKVKMGFENLDGSNCAGFEYILKESMSIKLRVDKSIQYVILEVYPGITVRGAHQPMVCEYCQRVTEFPGVAYLAVDPAQGNVYYHAESSFRDNPVTAKLLKKMEDAAINMLEKHAPVIDCLAYGRLPDWNAYFTLMEQEHKPDSVVGDAEVQNLLDRNIEKIRSLLMNSGHNVAAESVDRNSPVRYFLETMSKDMRYRDFVYIHECGWLIRSLRLDMKCGDAYRTQLAQYCNQASDEKKVGFLKVADDGYPYCTVVTSLLDGSELISGETLEEMGNIAATFLKFCEDKLRYIGHGVLPPDECDGEGSMGSIAKRILDRMMGDSRAKDTEDDGDAPRSLLDLLTSMHSDDEEDDSAPGSLLDLLSMMHADAEDDGDEYEEVN